MKLRKSILSLSLGFFVLGQNAFSDSLPLNDIHYSFDQNKVHASADAFHFLRSFVDYYYGLIAANQNSLHIVKHAGAYAGWCVGDAHPENFGILLQENGSPLFTMNDMDDSGPCPVAYDLLRIVVSSRLYRHDLDTKEVINSYLDGLRGKNASIPDAIKSMSKDSVKAGFEIESKDLQGLFLKRDKSMEEVDSSTKAQIATLLQKQYVVENLLLLDVVATAKVGGGSGGLQRYELLIRNNKNQFIHLELKELATPSMAVVATSAIPDQTARMSQSLQIEQGRGASHYYNVFNIQGKTMLLRPKFPGNIGVTLADSGNHDNDKIINFEAYILGRLHANSVTNVQAYADAIDGISNDKWEEDITAMTETFKKKFKELKK